MGVTFLVTKNGTLMAELLSFVELLSRCEFFESSNVTLVFLFTAQFEKYMAIFDEGDMNKW